MITALLQEDIAHHKSDDILRSDCFDYGNVNSIKTEILKLNTSHNVLSVVMIL